jgi:hypothetical protein
MSIFFSVLLSCIGRGLAMGRFAVQGMLLTCLNGFIISEIYYESEQAKGINA